MNVEERERERRRRRCCIVVRSAERFLLLAPFPIYASRVVTRPASGKVASTEERERERKKERDGTEKDGWEATGDETWLSKWPIGRQAASSRCFRTVCI